MSVAMSGEVAGERPWRRAALWLAGLAPFFYLSYGLANWLASVRPDVPSVVFAWERQVPFLAWTIVPYWTINAFYGLSLFLCRTRGELDTHGRRLLTAQVVAVACFVLVPLRFAFEKPAVDGGLSGFLFEALAGFDKPYNQAPSLHIALLVILWTFYARHLPRAVHPLLHVWASLIGVSVLTTWQHHFIDIPTGALLGLFCLWAWPDVGPSPLSSLTFTTEPRRIRLAVRYFGGALAVAALAAMIGGAGLWLLWPALSLWMVAACYAALGPAGFGKRPDGTLPLASRLLFGPYLLAAWVNSRVWTRAAPAPVEVAGDVYLGRIPSRRDLAAGRFGAVVDLSAELPVPRAGIPVAAFPVLDLTTPPAPILSAAASAIERARTAGTPVLVCCALGYSRSAAAVAAWLVSTGRAADAAAAAALIRRVRPGIVLTPAALASVDAAGRRP